VSEPRRQNRVAGSAGKDLDGGARFFAETRNENAVRARIARLFAYLQSIQTSARHARR
jgi:hypothetical protein